MIAIVVITLNRVGLLRKCVENVLLRTSDATTETVIFSTDGTADYPRDAHRSAFPGDAQPDERGDERMRSAFG